MSRLGALLALQSFVVRHVLAANVAFLRGINAGIPQERPLTRVVASYRATARVFFFC